MQVKSKKKGNPYEEYLINENKIKKLYNMYIHQSLFDRILDVLVLFAIILTFMDIVMSFFIEVSPIVSSFIKSFSAFILLIFIFELFREYLRSTSRRKFLKKHWIDIVLVVFLSFFFVASYFGISKLRGILSFKGIIQELKEYRILFAFFRR